MDGTLRPHWLTTDLVLSFFGTRKSQASRLLNEFIAQGVPERLRRRLDGSNWPCALGSKGFLEALRKPVERNDRLEVPQMSQWERRLRWEEVTEIVEEIYGISSAALRESRRGRRAEPRQAAVLLARMLARMSLQEIGLELCLQPSSVSRSFSRALAKQAQTGRFDPVLSAGSLKCRIKT